MNTPAVIATVACAAACLACVAAERIGARRGRAVTKALASTAFVVLPLAAGANPSADPITRWIFVGLVLGALGDLALLGRSRAWFLAGLGVFLAGHLAYVVAFAHRAPPATWLSPLAALPVAAAALALAWLWPHVGRLRGPVIAYVATIAAMAVAAVTVRIPLVTLGALLFFASDLAVARERFVAPGFINRAWGLPTYYSGQLLLAWFIVPG